MSRNKDARDKLVQERLKQILDELLRSDDNRYCADCNTKGKLIDPWIWSRQRSHNKSHPQSHTLISLCLGLQ